MGLPSPEMDSSHPGAFLADFLVRCPEQLQERLRVTAKGTVEATGRERGWASGSTHPDISILSVNHWVSLPNKLVALRERKDNVRTLCQWRWSRGRV